jgi:Fe-S-cluster containining protein
MAAAKVSPRLRELARATREVYAELERRPLERACAGRAECCRFNLTGKTPHLTRGEAVTTWMALRAGGRRELPAGGLPGACPLLHPQTRRCLAYEGRPFGCRTHFCAAAGGPRERREVLDLIRRLEALDAEAGGDGPKPIGSALREVAALF